MKLPKFSFIFMKRFQATHPFFEKLSNLSLKQKLIVSFVFISILPLAIVQIFAYFNSTQSEKSKIDRLVAINLTQSKKIMEITLGGYKDLVYQIYTDDEMINQVKKFNTHKETGFDTTYRLIWDKLGNMAKSKEGIASIAIFSPDGRVVGYDQGWDYYSVVANFWNNVSARDRQMIFSQAEKSKEIILLPAASYTGPTGDQRYFFHLALRMYDLVATDRKCIGVIVMSLDEGILADICNIGNQKSMKSINFIINRSGRIVSFPDKKLIGHMITSEARHQRPTDETKKYADFLKKIKVFHNQSPIINQINLASTDWILINAIDRGELFRDLYSLQKINLVVGVAVFVFSFFFMFSVFWGLSKSTKKVVDAMKAAQKDNLEVQIDLKTRDELSAVAANFNKMMARIHQLVEDVRQATHRQKEAEIRALEAQINPHFLYNTLDSINWMAVEKEDFEISKMLFNLAQVLRYSINKSNTSVKIRDEVEWLHKYLFLQQTRFNNSFESIIDFEAQILDFKIYKLLLQPLVENSIIHGFGGLECGGLLQISGRVQDDKVVIVIADNGKGMADESIKTLLDDAALDDAAADIPARENGLGVKNVFKRLKIYYGTSAELKITSTINVGTVVTLLIPQVM